LVTVGDEKPIADGETAEYCIDIEQGTWGESGYAIYQVASGYLNSDEYPSDAFNFKLYKSMYPNLTEGDAVVYLSVGEELDIVKKWVVNLQEFTE